MWQMLWPILIVIGANTLYHTCAKSTPADISPFASLVCNITVACILLFVGILLYQETVTPDSWQASPCAPRGCFSSENKKEAVDPMIYSFFLFSVFIYCIFSSCEYPPRRT